jgi:hypothetical protein
MEKPFSEIDRIKELAGITGEESGRITINIPENTSYQQFAEAVADKLKEDYGAHNFKPFMQALVNELKNQDQ